VNLKLEYRTVADFDLEFERVETGLRENGCFKALYTLQQYKDILRGLAYADIRVPVLKRQVPDTYPEDFEGF
jgi:hypothetical protein